MPLPSRTQLVLLETAGGAALVAFAFRGVWLPLGGAVALACLVLALVTVHGRPLHAVTRSWLGMRSRRPRRGRGDAASERDVHRVVTVPPGGRGASVGALAGQSTWSVPLALPLSGLLNEDPPLDLDRLATLLTIEAVPLASVRVVTVTTPAMPAAESLVGAAPRPSVRAARHLVLTLDTAYAADAIAARGGPPAIDQILRRCVLRAEEVLHAAGVPVMRLPEGAVAADAAGSLGRPAGGLETALGAVSESMGQVELPDAVARTFVVTGDDAVARVDLLALSVQAPVVATSVVLEPGSRQEPQLRVLLRASGPADVVAAAADQLRTTSRSLGLRVHPVLGEQLPMLQATTLLGVTRGTAA